MNEQRVLIAGAGIAGLGLARALRDRGLAPDVVERAGEVRPAGAGIFLPGNAMRALHDLGFGEAVVRRGHLVHRLRLADDRDRTLFDLRADDLWGDTAECVAVRHVDLRAALVEGTADVPVRAGTPVTGVAGGTVTFGDGSTDAYDLVVGADGIRSAVRAAVFPEVAPRSVGQVAWRSLAKGFVDGTWNVWQGRDRTFLALSLGGGWAYCYADAVSSATDPPHGDWRRLYASFPGPVPDLVDQGADAHFSVIEEVAVPSPARGTTVLVGDAAHAQSPNMAQGAAMALEDAIVLAAELGDGPLAAALDRYVSRRAARVAWVRGQTQRRDRVRLLRPPIRDTVIRLLGPRLTRAAFRPLQARP
jgi:2-polyprenyl-6-methoxyphenol hydroxylase-like FAD-dependent oxidoreductase